ncbi:MAG TPA: ATP-binding protein [Thermoanaerobaculia bacterium]|nr:ATP-binding protein [Thermoanaerobaculia bacterium]
MKTVEDAVGPVLSGAISAITQRSIFNRLGGLVRVPVAQLGAAERQTILKELESSLRLFSRGNSAELVAACKRALDPQTQPAASAASAEPAAPSKALHKVFTIELEKDIASARLEAWSEAVRLGLSKFMAVKVATAVSELARNIVFYAGQGTVELSSTEDERGARLHIVAKDQGPGIEPAKLEEIWAGTYKSPRGMGKGLLAVKKLVTDFHLETAPGKGTTVTCVFRGER